MFETKLTTSQKWISLVLSLVIALAVVGLMQVSSRSARKYKISDLFLTLSNEINDRFVVRRNSRSGMEIFARENTHVVVVGIDEQSMASLGIWPWDRRIHARLIERLAKAGARVIAFDVLFLDPTKPQADQELAGAVAAHPQVVLASFSYPDLKDFWGRLVVKLPLATTLTDMLGSEGAREIYRRCGSVAVTPDKDEVVRRIPLVIPKDNFFGGDTALLPGDGYSYDVVISALSEGLSPDKVGFDPGGRFVRIGSREIPTRKGQFLVNYGMYQRPKGELRQESGASLRVLPFFDQISYSDVLTGLSDKDLVGAVAGKTVLVGSTIITSTDQPFDMKSTPLGSMPGVWIHANVIESILQGKFLRDLGPTAAMVLCLGLGLLMGLVLPRLKFFPGVGFTLLLVAGLLTGLYVLFARQGLVLDGAGPVFTPLFCLLGLSVYHRHLQEQAKQEMKMIFGQYLDPKVVDALVDMKHQGVLGLRGKKEKVTIFYSDIRGFTNLSEKLAPEEVVSLLNDYFQAMSGIANKYEAYIDKFIGDCMMAVFSAPLPRPDDARRAVLAAWEMMREAERMQEGFAAQGRSTFKVGMGINTGEVVLGNIGSSMKRDYTVIGDNVNLAARLYAAAKGGQILISQATYEEVKDLVEVAALEPIMVKGKAQPVAIYEITGLKDTPADSAPRPSGKEHAIATPGN